MELIKSEEMLLTTGGDAVGTACTVIGLGTGVYAVGILTNWWNPIGWVSSLAAVADLACATYTVVDIFNE